VSSCTCSVVRATSETIAPGATEEFQFVLKTDGHVGPKSGSVVLKFSGDRTIDLRCTALVTLPMAPTVEKVQWKVNPGNTPEVRKFEILNYGDNDWEDIVATDVPDWLKVSGVSHTAIERLDVKSPRQRWAVKLEPLVTV